MGEGLIAPKTVNAIKKYRQELDNAGATPKPDSVPSQGPFKKDLEREREGISRGDAAGADGVGADGPVAKPMTVSEAQAKAAKYKREREDFDKSVGMPKPSLLDRAKKLIGM